MEATELANNKNLGTIHENDNRNIEEIEMKYNSKSSREQTVC